ncbi:MAG: hypothetical protein AABX37_05440 [Nanoarchaeota archaeon]
MIDNQAVALITVFIEAIGILLAEKRTAFLLGLATILTIIIFFII